MIKLIKSIPFHVKSAGKSVIRHLALTISSSSAVMVTLLLMSLFLLIAGNIGAFTKNIEKGLGILAEIDDSVSEQADLDALQQEIEALPHVEAVSFSSKDEQLDRFISNQDKSAQSLYEAYRGEGNPLHAAFDVSVDDGKNLETVQKALEKMDGRIVKADFGGTTTSDLVDGLSTVRIAGGALTLVLSCLAIFLISNTIKTTIYSRSHEIAIMRNVGATNGFIKMPFMIEGMIIGLIGAIIPMLITFFGYRYLYGVTGGKVLSSAMFTLQPIYPFVLQVCGLLLLAGIVVGLVGSFLAVTKYLRWKR